MKYSVHLPERPYFAIKNGSKKVEGRVPESNNSKYSKMKKGDILTICLESNKENFLASIQFVHHYSSFKEMLQVEKPENVLSSRGNIKQGIESYNNLSGYKENVKKYGVFAIGVKAI